MLSSELTLFAVAVKGRHPDLISKRYRGVALNIGQAMDLAVDRAMTDGWDEIEFDEVTDLGPVSFAPWLTMADEEDEVARMDDKLTQVEALERGEVTHENG
jgi:hypothetical protein